MSRFSEHFSTDEMKIRFQADRIQEIPLSELYPFSEHPYKVLDNQDMLDLAESIAEQGVMEPALVRPRPEGGYELLSGHRRHRASQLVGKETMPVIVRDMDDAAAGRCVVDANKHREEILPSERAYAYRLKLESIKKQGERNDLTSTQVAQKLSAEIVGEEDGVSKDTVRRYIRLTELVIELLDMVDNGKLALNTAVELSYLKPKEQHALVRAIDYAQSVPSKAQAIKFKKESQSGALTEMKMRIVLSAPKKEPNDKVVLKKDTLKTYFPASYTPRQMEKIIIELLEQWKMQLEKKKER